MKFRNGFWVVAAATLLSAGCNKEAKEPVADKPAASKPTPDKPNGDKPDEGQDHGAEQRLGALTLAGYSLDVAALGSLAAGSDAAIAVKVDSTPEGADWQKLSLYVWVEDAAGKKLCPPEKAVVEKGRLHAHASIPKSVTTPAAAVVLRIRQGGVDERGKVPVGAQGAATSKPHEHEKTPHDGVVAALGEAGFVELKLHDDKGDLELWLTRDKAGSKPLDIALDAKIAVTFIDRDNKQVTLAPRNRDKNEDEDGNPTLRDGKTNYFIFPGDTGADAAWLMGKSFASLVSVKVSAAGIAGGQANSAEFVLRPHTHAPGQQHD